MKSLDIGDGDQVFVPAHTFFATASTVLGLGADPIIVDIDPQRYTMDPALLRQSVEAASNPVAVVVTHMHGQPVEMDPIHDVVSEFDLLLIEDAAQAHLAQYKDRQVGGIGDVGCFSFYPTKNMTVGGDGGMIVTDNADVATMCRGLRNHGRDEHDQHSYLGLNFRLDEVKSAIGREQLRHLPDWTKSRRANAQEYNQRLDTIEEVITPSTFEQAKHVYHHYPVQVPEGDRGSFRSYLDEVGIGTGVHYERAVHKQPAIRERIPCTSAPNAENLCKRIVSLPMHPQLNTSEIEYVCDVIKEYFE